MAAVRTSDSRPLVGVLAAPELGQIFAVRAGKNRIGASAENEVRLIGDAEVSGDHAVILFRGETFYLADRMSTNGTFRNGEMLDPTSNAVILEDHDRVRCGATELVFLRIPPREGRVVDSPGSEAG